MSTPPSAHGREHVDVGGQRGLRGSVHAGAEPVGELAAALVDVGQHELGAGLGEQLGQPAADVPTPTTATLRPSSDVLPNDALAGDADRGLDAERGPRARVAGAAALDGEPGDVRASTSAIVLHVGLRRADVLGGEVRAVERLDGLAEVEQHGAAVLAGRAARCRRAA